MKNFKLKRLLTLFTATLLTTVAISSFKASAAWKQSANGNWSYTEANTSVSGWKSIDGKWYFFDSNAVMKTGWLSDGSTWYYTDPSGEMKTGWVNDGGKWYFTASSGAMQTGWVSDNGSWYYLNTSGDMKTGLVELNNKTYYLGDSGAMKTGNVTVNGTSYAFAANGEKITTTNTTASASGTTTTSSGSSSGGSGGGASPSATIASSLYKSLYGTWTVKSYITSTGDELTEANKKLCIGQPFTISENSIIATIPSIGTVNAQNPKIKESSMTVSDFNKTWNLNVTGTTVNIVQISYAGYSVYIYVTDNNTYVSYKGTKGTHLFEIEK